MSDNNYSNPISGRNSAAPRFQFRIRSIARKNLYLPLRMKSLKEIQRLLNGESPLNVFGCDSIFDARQAFYRLRKRFDFPYWAALDCQVPDKDNPGRLVPLILNQYQHHVADVFMKRALEGRRGIYLISKSVPKCGLSTVVQAYILWLQLYSWHENSIFYAPSNDSIRRFKGLLCRSLKIDKNLEDYMIGVPDSNHGAYYTTYLTPAVLSGIKCGFIHFSDMSKWYDRNAELSSRIFSSSLSGLKRNPAALVVLEGDSPSIPQVKSYANGLFLLPEQIRYMKLEEFGINPFFIDKWLMASDPNTTTILHHIHLDSK